MLIEWCEHAVVSWVCPKMTFMWVFGMNASVSRVNVVKWRIWSDWIIAYVCFVWLTPCWMVCRWKLTPKLMLIGVKLKLDQPLMLNWRCLADECVLSIECGKCYAKWRTYTWNFNFSRDTLLNFFRLRILCTSGSPLKGRLGLVENLPFIIIKLQKLKHTKLFSTIYFNNIFVIRKEDLNQLTVVARLKRKVIINKGIC